MQFGYNQLGVKCSQLGTICGYTTDWIPYPATCYFEPRRGKAALEPTVPELGIVEPTSIGMAAYDQRAPIATQEQEPARAAYEEGIGNAVYDTQRPTSIQEVFKGKAENEPRVADGRYEPRKGKSESDVGKVKTEES